MPTDATACRCLRMRHCFARLCRHAMSAIRYERATHDDALRRYAGMRACQRELQRARLQARRVMRARAAQWEGAVREALPRT